MRPRREIYAFGTVIAICILVALGAMWFQRTFDAAPLDAPEDHNIVEDAPEDVEENPPGAVGTISEP